MEIYNRYPFKELIIHPRVRNDYYKNTPNLDVFEEAVKNSVNPVVYNGDLFRIPEFLRFAERFPDAEAVMIGRGLIRNPELAERILSLSRTEKAEVDGFDRARFREFHDLLLSEYRERMSGEIPVLYKMKELWFYMMSMFPDSGKIEKKIKKSKRLAEYRAAVDELFQ